MEHPTTDRGLRGALASKRRDSRSQLGPSTGARTAFLCVTVTVKSVTVVAPQNPR